MKKVFYAIWKAIKVVCAAIGDFFRKDIVKYSLQRLLTGFITLVLLISVVFLLLRAVPIENYYNYDLKSKMPEITWQVYCQNIAHKFGYDQNVFVALFKYLVKVFPYPREVCQSYVFDADNVEYCEKVVTKWIDLGSSVRGGVPVTDRIKETFPVSFRIGMIVLVFTYLIGYPLGVFMSKKVGGVIDKIGNGYVVLVSAIPSLVIYYCFVLLNFGTGISVFYDATRPVTLVIPILASVFMSVPGTAIYVRRFMVDQMSSDYVKFARSKGLSENKILFKHVLRNAVVPIIRNIPGSIIACLTGAYFMESMWAIPGSGKLLINAMNGQAPDNTLVQGLVIIYSLISMISFLLGDIITVIFDPRIKLSGKR